MSIAEAETKRRQPPGPKGHWLKGHLSDFARDRLGYFTWLHEEYGDVVAIRLATRRLIVVFNPEMVEDVLVAKNRLFIKHFALRKGTEQTLGRGLLTSEGDFWRKQRKLAQPAFHRERVAAHARMMAAYSEEAVDTWADGERRDVHDDMMRLTLRIVAKALFDADVSGDAADASQAMETVLKAFTARVNRFVKAPRWLPTPFNANTNRAVARLDRIVYRIIAARRASGADHGDLLSMLLAAQDDEDGKGMSDRQLRDEAMTLFMAGHETTANTLAWAWYLLATHPEAEARLHAELDSVLGGRTPGFDDLPKLPFADMVITETLRLYPTAWVLGREAIERTEVGGYDVPVGRTVYMPQWVIHRDPRFFDEPLAFRPERWEDGLAKRIPRYAYFPFGGGPRICIGNAFAQMEAVLLLATIARRYRLKLAEGAVINPLPSMTLRPEFGVPVVLERRR
jgi:cytochrome P450